MKNGREEVREAWRQRIVQQENSGGTVRGFCKENGLAEHAFYGWRQRLRNDGPVTFALVENKQVGKETPMLELVLTQGERLRIPADESSLRLVLRVLRERH